MEQNLNVMSLPAPPAWSLNVGSLGKGLVWVAVVLYLISVLGWLFSPKFPSINNWTTWIFRAANIAVIGTFACLAALFLANRFEYQYVWEHSDNRNAFQYRFAGIWSGQQGSFLLWATCSAIFGLATIHKVRHYQRWYGIATSVFLGMIVAILAFESPFNLIEFDGPAFVPADGFGLAPSLQNYWVIIHPPTIFLGFGSLTALFALGFAALATRDYTSWSPIVRPLSIISLTLVGLGLCMGGFWAYETLGWGGFWMWDPVENVSFVPWCFGIALTHGIIVQTTRKKWIMTNLLLAGVPFLMFMYGTFLTRSGFLSEASVHSFAEMDSKAMQLLIGILGLTVVGYFGLWGVRMFQNRKESGVTGAKLTRDRWMALGIWALSLMGLATFVGMSVPLIMALQGQKPSIVKEGLYHQVLPYIFVPLMLLMAITPFLGWNQTDKKQLWSKVYTVACYAVGITSILMFLAIITGYNQVVDLTPKVLMFNRFEVNGMAWVMFLIATCMFVIVGNVWRCVDLWKRSKLGISGFLAHIGLAVLMTGLIVSRGFERKGDAMLMSDQPTQILGYQLKMTGMSSNDRDRENKILIDVLGPNNQKLYTAKPGMYRTTMGDGQESIMLWPDIHRGLLHDTYISLGQPQTTGTQDVALQPGKSVSFGELTLTYKKLVVDGEFGKAGTKFGAVVEVNDGKTTQTLTPKIEIGQNRQGMVEHPAKIDEKMTLAMSSMNAADKSVSLRIDLNDPVYAVEVFHKPLTNWVFFGTFLTTVAGVLAAWYRRPTLKSPIDELKTSPKDKNSFPAPDKELILTGSK